VIETERFLVRELHHFARSVGKSLVRHILFFFSILLYWRLRRFPIRARLDVRRRRRFGGNGESRYNVKRAPRERRGRRGSAASVVFSIVVDSLDSSSDPEKPRENFFKNYAVSPFFYVANREIFLRRTKNFFRFASTAKKNDERELGNEGANAAARRKGGERFLLWTRGKKLVILATKPRFFDFASRFA
jgi:hypothetical protein